MIFVDGLHTYAGVAADANAWLPKLRRPGGALVFNDYLLIDAVTRAVNDFARGHGYDIQVRAISPSRPCNTRAQMARHCLQVGNITIPPGIYNAAIVF